jgi:hypothetical protein
MQFEEAVVAFSTVMRGTGIQVRKVGIARATSKRVLLGGDDAQVAERPATQSEVK